MTVILPKLKVEIGFAGTPFVPTFTDVTTDYRVYAGCPIEYGRGDNRAQPKTATATFILDNAAGKYTPDNTGSTFYPNVRRGRAVRISATEDGVTYYPRYYGYIDTISIVWDDSTGLMAGTQITCVDLLSLLSTVTLRDSLVNFYMSGASLLDYWPLDDPVGTVQPRNIGTQGSAGQRVYRFLDDTTSAATVFGADGLPYDGPTSMTLIDAQYGAHNAPSTVYPIASHGFAAMGFFKFDSGIPAGQPSVLLFQDIATGSICLSVDIVSGIPFVDMNEIGLPGATIAQNVSSGVRVDDGLWHHYGVAYQAGAGGTLRLSIDGIERVNVTGVGASVSTGYGWWALALCPVSTPSGTMELAHVGAEDGNISAVSFANIANAGLAGCAGESSGARIARLALLWTGSVVTPTIIGTPGTQNMGPLVSLAGANVLDQMLDTMKTENGWLYVDRTGVLTMRSRLARYNQAAALTLPAESYDPTILFTQDRTLYVNDQVATAFGSTNPQEVIASSSSSDWFAPDSETLLTRDDTEALAFAQWIVGTGLPVTRSPEIPIDGMTQQGWLPGLLVAFWQLDLGELVALQSLPAAAPSTNINYLAEGVKENLTTTGYAVSITTSAAPATGAWVLQDAVLGLLGSTTYLAY